MKTPVALIIFNRPHTTERVFREIARAKPSRLFIIADGPRHDRPDDKKLCNAARNICDQVDWQCEVFRFYSKTNLGTHQRIFSGLNGVFKQVDRCIILEDDVLPHKDFFPFCEELLERYINDKRIMFISGKGPQTKESNEKYSYFFSRCTIALGWATWLRAWEKFDVKMKLWPEMRNMNWLTEILGDQRWFEVVHKTIENNFNHTFDPVDVAWMFHCHSQSSFAIRPYCNLLEYISNIDDATHQGLAEVVDKSYHVPTLSISFPLKHPPYMVRDKNADLMLVQPILDSLISYLNPKDNRNLFSQIIPKRLRRLIPQQLRSWILNKFCSIF